MVVQLNEILDDLAGEVRGLLYHDQQVTGFSLNDILVQSSFFHYPEIFSQLSSDLSYFFFLSRGDYQRVMDLLEYSGLNIQQLLSDLFGFTWIPPTGNSLKPDDLEHILQLSPDFVDFNPKDRFIIFLEKLILRYHLMIQPEALLGPSLRGDPSSGFVAIQFCLNHKDAMQLLNYVSQAGYMVRRPGYTILQYLLQRYSLVSDLYFQR